MTGYNIGGLPIGMGVTGLMDHTVDISANCMWNSDNGDPANFTVPAGWSVKFWAIGTWLTHPHGPDGGPWNGPAGNGVPNQGTYPCSGPESCMVIFTSPAAAPGTKPNPTVWDWFKTNNQTFNYQNTNQYDVTFYFAANDNTYDNCSAYNDNKGSITVYYQFPEEAVKVNL